ncbi:hypothetical protein [Sphaerisporangium sp. NPDC051011]|uniref:hypothetical protein n=1 Tax=Sphaerisporangium sp. NPDC051011 TaxID=3155792 RepID=UPI0034116037
MKRPTRSFRTHDSLTDTRDWNVPHPGVGSATRFQVRSNFLSRYPVQQAGGRTIYHKGTCLIGRHRAQ